MTTDQIAHKCQYEPLTVFLRNDRLIAVKTNSDDYDRAMRTMRPLWVGTYLNASAKRIAEDVEAMYEVVA